ncbi:MAG: hypothetical protein AAFP93_02710 [Bacteroidota bacterium]
MNKKILRIVSVGGILALAYACRPHKGIPQEIRQAAARKGVPGVSGGPDTKGRNKGLGKRKKGSGKARKNGDQGQPISLEANMQAIQRAPKDIIPSAPTYTAPSPPPQTLETLVKHDDWAKAGFLISKYAFSRAYSDNINVRWQRNERLGSIVKQQLEILKTHLITLDTDKATAEPDKAEFRSAVAHTTALLQKIAQEPHIKAGLVASNSSDKVDPQRVAQLTKVLGHLRRILGVDEAAVAKAREAINNPSQGSKVTEGPVPSSNVATQTSPKSVSDREALPQTLAEVTQHLDWTSKVGFGYNSCAFPKAFQQQINGRWKKNSTLLQATKDYLDSFEKYVCMLQDGKDIPEGAPELKAAVTHIAALLRVVAHAEQHLVGSRQRDKIASERVAQLQRILTHFKRICKITEEEVKAAHRIMLSKLKLG